MNSPAKSAMLVVWAGSSVLNAGLTSNLLTLCLLKEYADLHALLVTLQMGILPRNVRSAMTRVLLVTIMASVMIRNSVSTVTHLPTPGESLKLSSV